MNPSPRLPSRSLAKARRLFRRPVTHAFLLLLTVVACAGLWLLGDMGQRAESRDGRRRFHHAARLPRPVALSVERIPSAEELPLEPRVAPLTQTDNLLIAGMDRRPGAKGSGLTDTLIVVAIEKRTGKIGLISVPRDIAVEVPDHGLDRINTVYGLSQAKGEDGLTALKSSVSKLLALPIHHAVVVDLSVFEQLIDTLGGVDISVPCPIIDDFIDNRTADGRRVLNVPAGQVHMDGATAAMYVRSRHGRSDFSRARRQQAVLDAIHRELLSLGNLGKIPEALATLERGVTTDLKRYQILDLARRALGVSREQVHAMVLADTELEPLRDKGRWMLTPKLDAIDRAVAKLYLAPAPGEGQPRGNCPAADIALRHRDPSGKGEPRDLPSHPAATSDNVRVVSIDGASPPKL